MQIKPNTVVEFNYTLVDDEGKPIDGTPVRSTAILHGRRQVIRGVERALEGHSAGDRLEVSVPPEDGYGMRREGWTQRVSKKHFVDVRGLQPGAVAELKTPTGSRPVTVLKVGGKVVDVDLNHPHAGQTLNFEIEITDVRQPTAQELGHGHAHGRHGVHHP